ncbi:MAG: 16S rRNA (guanine(527)-N(7))-methyltransferase RsmG [Selenomonas sp.]|uniref:16S rRNA (guanine(527)-N(7))-methyltransferase RsmG n=1 Tax=Selenomonas sp. TaxID=2053611 RepID=UPI0025F1D9D2|nr:16S rRNA (guanine(527)-N(7))-methyltransferase RsmG [Selenomonas sp.]MCI6232916.1 16S rRNA (guanine(527)-N(7))-methyltransferase RsmG [Selenomonas sp.]
MTDFTTELRAAAEAASLSLSEDQILKFTRYDALLVDWNERMNLTAITEPRDVAVKHMIDSLTAYDKKLFDGAPTVIDVGTGAGFPGVPLKIFDPSIRLTLMDSLAKRLAFLEAVVEDLGLTGVTCVHARAEDAAREQQHRERYDIAVSRAVARLPVLLEYTLPFVKKGGHLIALKGRTAEEEATDAKRALKLLGGRLETIRPVTLPGLSDKRAVLTITKIAPTPKAYPRKAGTPAKKPL